MNHDLTSSNRTTRQLLIALRNSLVIALTIIVSTQVVSAQFQVNKRTSSLRSSKLPYPGEKISRIVKEVRADGWILFNETLKDNPESIASKYKEAFGLGATDELRTTTNKKDELGITRYRYTQFHEGIPVEGADFSIYAKASQAVSANGRLVQNLVESALPTVTERVALEVALASVPAKQYLWQNKQAEQHLRTARHDSSATNFPKGQLLYALSANDGNALGTVHRLAYRFEVVRLVPDAHEAVYVDAQTGQLLRKVSLLHASSCQTNRVDTWYNGTNNLDTWWNSLFNAFQLRDYCRGTYILTKAGDGNGSNDWDVNSSYLFAAGSENNALNTNWNTDFKARSAASAHFAAQAAHYYFQTRFNHIGGHGDGKEMRIVANNYADQSLFTYLNDDDYLVIGRTGSDGLGNSFAELDVVAHEFTHAVVNGTAMLANGGESEALNESFADIFGEMVELMHTGTHDWVFARRMGRPRAFAGIGYSYALDPAQVYHGRYWDFNGEPHRNSGVQSRWFYLLSVGGAGDFGVSVTGIGEEKAARIAYRNLTTYLGPNSTYADARSGAIQAAIDLYGVCSAEAAATTDAWAAVGVGQASPGFCAADITGIPSFCLERGTTVSTTYTVSASPGATKNWSSTNASFIFTQLGVIDYVTLTGVPAYGDNTTLQVDISFPNSGANVTRYFQISTRQCRPEPCPPGIQKCDETGPQAKTSANQKPLQATLLYPNPSSSSTTLTLAAPTTSAAMVYLKDMTGRILHTQPLAVGQQTTNLDVTSLPVGAFILSITNATGTTSQRLLISR